jgi:hypothetical protein
MKIKISKILYSLFAFTLLISCEKNLIDQNQEWQFANENASNIKIINTYSHVLKTATTTRFLGYLNNNLIMGNGLAAPGVWPGSTYAQVNPGTGNILLLQDRKVAAVGYYTCIYCASDSR